MFRQTLSTAKESAQDCFQPPYIRAHTDALFLEHKILKLKDLYSFQLGQFMFKYNNNHLPKIFNDSFHIGIVTYINIPRVELMNSIFPY